MADIVADPLSHKTIVKCDIGLSEKGIRFSDTVSTHLCAVAMDIANRVGSVSADDLHDDPALLGDKDGRIIGAVLRGLVRAGKLKHGGYFKSTRKECHHRPVCRFELA